MYSIALSIQGENKNVDMLVGDIYGGYRCFFSLKKNSKLHASDYPKIGLKATTIASSFGKVFKMPQEERKLLREEDISKSLLYLVSNNIGQIAYLNARSHQITK
jgi:pantothenate kinase